MSHTRREYLALMAGAAAATVLPRIASAEGEPVVHEVQMLNKNPDNKKQKMIFLPDIVRANPGDTIKFISADKGHNSVSDDNMLPEGAQSWSSKISKDFEVTVTAEGTYGYFCKPHRAMGMVGLILVGDPSSNYDAAKATKQKGKAKKVYKDIFERADAMLAAEA